MRLRQATLADLGEIERQGENFYAARGGGAAGLAGSLEGRRAYIKRSLETGFAVIAEDARGYLGSLALERRRFDHGPGEFLADRWWHAVDPRAALALHRFGRLCASRLGLPLYLTQSTGYQAARISRLHERLGGTLVGAIFRFDP